MSEQGDLAQPTRRAPCLDVCIYVRVCPIRPTVGLSTSAPCGFMLRHAGDRPTRHEAAAGGSPKPRLLVAYKHINKQTKQNKTAPKTETPLDHRDNRSRSRPIAHTPHRAGAQGQRICIDERMREEDSTKHTMRDGGGGGESNTNMNRGGAEGRGVGGERGWAGRRCPTTDGHSLT